MSEENSNESMSETVEHIVEKVEETVEAVEEAVEEAVDTSVPFLMKLKQDNPIAFFGGIAGVVLVVILFMLSGEEGVGQQKQVAISMGNTYTLQAPNSLDGANATLKILKVPGQMSAFDNDSDDDVTCTAPVGTSVTVRDSQDAFGTSQMFVQVEVNQAVNDCRAGVKGWTVRNNLK